MTEVQGVTRGRDLYTGARVARREDGRLLRGRGRFVGDIKLPGMLHAAFVRSPHAHARILHVEVAAARSADASYAVLTAEDLPRIGPERDEHLGFVDYAQAPGLAKTPQPVLARDVVRFVGEPVAIVVAESRALAEDAAELVDVSYEPLTPHLRAKSSASADTDLLFAGLGTNVVYRSHRVMGNPEAAFARAAHVVRHCFESNRHVAAPMEGAGIVAEFDSGSGELQVYASTQAVHLLRTRLAEVTGLGTHRIRVEAPDVGGAFGQKIPIRSEEAATALAAIQLARPVQWLEDRYENLIAAPHAKEQEITLDLALDEDGTFLAMRAEIIGDSGAYSHNTASALIEPHHASTIIPGVYKLQDYEVTVSAVLTNKSPVAPYRGVGFSAGTTVRELAIDEAARLLGCDPGELRLRNMIPSGELPYRSCTGMVYDSGSYQESLRAVLEALDYEAFRGEQEAARGEGRYLGLGVSAFVEPTGWGSEGARQAGSSSFITHDSARVTMDPSGKVLIAAGTNSQGQGHETAMCQVVADALGVDLNDVVLLRTDTGTAPISTPGTRASRSAVVTGGAFRLAAEDVRDRILAIASALLEASSEDLRLGGGRVEVAGAPGVGIPIRDVAHAAHFDTMIREAVPEPTLTSERFYDPGPTYANGCFGATVEVDPLTGAVRLLRFVAVEDCGTIINPLIVDGQIHGAVAQGIGGALFEHMRYGDDGQILTSTFMDYLLPGAYELPTIEVSHLCSPSPNTVGGVKGTGESGVIGTPAAVGNAIADALSPFGMKVESMPLNPQSIVCSLEKARGEPHGAD